LNENLRLAPRPHGDGVVGSDSSTTATQLVGKICQMTFSDNLTNVALVTTSNTTLDQSSKVNFVQTTTFKTSQQPRGKKKNNNNRRKKIFYTKTIGQTNQETNAGGCKSERKFKYPCMVYQKDHMTKYCPILTNVRNYVKQGQPSSKPAVLTNPFPSPKQMVAQALTPPSAGASSSSTTILMDDVVIGISMRAKNYDQPEGSSNTKDTPSTSQPNSSLTLAKPTSKLPSHHSKVRLGRTMHNFNT